MKHLMILLALATSLGAAAHEKNKDGKSNTVFTGQKPRGPVAENYQKIDNLLSFSVVRKSGNTYLNWRTEGEPEDCIYVIQRSSDGIHFHSVGIKKGFGTEVHLVFLYSWVDRDDYPEDSFAYYRVKKIDASNSCRFTKSIRVEYEQPEKTVPMAETVSQYEL